jgi:hypothetical protein
MERPLIGIARGRPGHWEAVSLDFDIAVQGQSFKEVEALLIEAVETYIEDAMHEDEPTRERLLSRRAPLRVTLSWLGAVIFAALCGRTSRREGAREASSATVPFAVPCHA